MATDSKTEKATPKKRRDERKEGHVFFSRDIANLAIIIVSFYSLKFLFPGIYEALSTFTVQVIDNIAGMENAVGIGQLAKLGLWTLAKCIIPFLLICLVISIIGTGIQTKFLFSKKSMTPQFSRLSPIRGIKNLFSLKNVVELLKSILKVVILVWIVWSLIKKDIVSLVRTMDMDVTRGVMYTFSLVMEMVIKISIIFVFIAAFDYLYQWWDYERNIKMSKEELKEEYKQTEGNPEIKGKIKENQRKMAMSRMMQEVPKADVVIKNPTHFAVALRYDIEKDHAPILLAKGQDEVAFRIIKIAEENNITVIENKPLARGIFASTELKREIPAEFYGAVADILVYVFKLNKKGGVS